MAGSLSNRTYRIIVAGTTETLLADAAKATLDAAPAGQIGFFNGVSNATVAAGDDIQDHPSFYILRKGANGTVKTSFTIEGANVTKYEGQSFAAEAQKVVTVDLSANQAATIVGGQIELAIVFKDSYDSDILPYRQYKKVYTVAAENATEATAAVFATRLAALINADKAVEVTASAAGNIVTITAKAQLTLDRTGQYPNQVDFDAFSQGIYVNENAQKIYEDASVITTTTAINFGSGTDRQMRIWEDRQQGYLGHLNRIKFPVDVLEYDAVLGGNYDIYVIEHANVHEAGQGLVQYGTALETTLLAIPSAVAALTTAVEGVLNPYMASTPRKFAAVAL